MASSEIKHRARLDKDLAPTSPVLGSEGRLSQVFLNLLVNAVHAIPLGDPDHNRIGVKTWQQGQTVFAQVEDTGCGIAPTDLPRLFEPFFSKRPAGQGTGLGLFISSTLIRQMGGSIRVQSEVGKGSSFVIELSAESAPGARGDGR